LIGISPVAVGSFLADRTATPYDRLLASLCRLFAVPLSVCLSVCLSGCNAVHSGSQGRCTSVTACSYPTSVKFLFVRSDTFAVGCIV